MESVFYRDLAYVFVAAMLGGMVAHKLRQPLMSLREDLEDMAIRGSHDLEDLLDVIERHELVKEVAHAVHEDPAWFPPV